MFFGGVGGVRMRVGNTCGSGSLLRVMGDGAYWLTNAHVVGTSVGRAVSIESVGLDGRIVSTSGRVAAAGYRRGTSVDWAVVESPVLRGFEGVARLLGPAMGGREILTVGSPRCEQPSMRRLGFVRVNSGVGYATPVAIGGQSGSGVFQGMRCIGLITWSNGRETLYQTAEGLERTMSPDFFDGDAAGFELPEDAVPCCENPQVCDDGFHGALQCSQFWSADFGDFDWQEFFSAAGPLLTYLFNVIFGGQQQRSGVHSDSAD